MMITNYALEFQPPEGRDNETNLSYYLKRKGRKHFEALKKELPVLQNVEVEAQAEQSPTKDDTNDEELKKKLDEEHFRKLLIRCEWTGIGPFGRLLEPKVIPLNMTPAEEQRLWKLYEETEFCMAEDNDVIVRDKDKKYDGEGNEMQPVSSNAATDASEKETNEQQQQVPRFECLAEKRQNDAYDAMLRQNYKKYQTHECNYLGC